MYKIITSTDSLGRDLQPIEQVIARVETLQDVNSNDYSAITWQDTYSWLLTNIDIAKKDLADRQAIYDDLIKTRDGINSELDIVSAQATYLKERSVS